MLEYCKNGSWDTVILGNGIIGLAIKFKIDYILLKPMIPSFHYSIVRAKTHVPEDTIYFHLVLEIPRRLSRRTYG